MSDFYFCLCLVLDTSVSIIIADFDNKPDDQDNTELITTGTTAATEHKLN